MSLDVRVCILIIQLPGSDLVDRLRNSREEVESSDDFRSLKHLAKLLCEVTSQQQYQLEELTQEVDALSEVDDTTLDSLIQNSKRREKSLDDLLASAYDLERALLQVNSKQPRLTFNMLRCLVERTDRHSHLSPPGIYRRKTNSHNGVRTVAPRPF